MRDRGDSGDVPFAFRTSLRATQSAVADPDCALGRNRSTFRRASQTLTAAPEDSKILYYHVRCNQKKLFCGANFRQIWPLLTHIRTSSVCPLKVLEHTHSLFARASLVSFNASVRTYASRFGRLNIVTATGKRKVVQRANE